MKSFKELLSKSPIIIASYILFVLFGFLLLLSNDVLFAVKVLYSIIFVFYSAFVLTGGAKTFFGYSAALIMLIILDSYASIYLENAIPGITGIYLPANLFVFFSSAALFENYSKLKKELKIVYSLLLSITSILISFLVVTFIPNITPYITLANSIFIVGILFAIFYLKKETNKENE